MIVTLANSDKDGMSKWMDEFYPSIWRFSISYWDRKSKYDFLPLSSASIHIKFDRHLSTSELVHIKMVWEILVIRTEWGGEILWELD